jgi:hypothetical protein
VSKNLDFCRQVVTEVTKTQCSDRSSWLIVVWGHPHSSSPSSISFSLHITAALSRCLHHCLATKMALCKRDYLSRPRLPTPPPNQWQGQPESRTQNKRGEFSEQHHQFIASVQQFTPTLVKLTHQSRQLSGVSRRRKLRLAARPRCLVDWAQQHPAEHANCQSREPYPRL